MMPLPDQLGAGGARGRELRDRARFGVDAVRALLIRVPSRRPGAALPCGRARAALSVLKPDHAELCSRLSVW